MHSEELKRIAKLLGLEEVLGLELGSLDELGQKNIIDYVNHEPMLYGGDRSIGGPGSILVNNEPSSRSPKPTDGYRPGIVLDKSTHSQVGDDRTQPGITTGAPTSPINKLRTENDESAIPAGLVEQRVATKKDFEGGAGSGRKALAGFAQQISEKAPLIASQAAGLLSHAMTKKDDPIGGEYSYGEMREALIKSDIIKAIKDAVNQEAFVESEHQRAEAGSSEGGQFVSSDEAPTGKSKEDRTAREEFYKATNSDNMKVESLYTDVVSKTIDANIAKIHKDSKLEEKLRGEVEVLKKKRDDLAASLSEKNRLEGVQVQRTLQTIDEAKEKVANAKEGSKAWENAMMDQKGNELRLDLIRRGTIADFDINNKPTNQAGYEQQQEEKRVEKAMSKKPVKTQQSDLAGFKTIKNIKLGKNVDKNHVTQIEELWNGLDESDRKLVDNMMIRSSRASGRLTAGEWKAENNQMEITIHPLFTKKDYEETMHHEIAHAKFKKYPSDKVEAWNKAVDKLEPPTRYAQYHNKRYDDYYFKNIYVTAEDKPIVERNLKALKNLYYEEIHSEVYANQKSPLDGKKIWSKDGLDEATKIYKEMFD